MNPEDVSRITAGHKANISNPNTSEESKKHSKDVLENEISNAKMVKDIPDVKKNPGNVAGGLKTTINNPNVSEEAKENAKQRLENDDL